jgi:hypothetical protein
LVRTRSPVQSRSWAPGRAREPTVEIVKAKTIF